MPDELWDEEAKSSEVASDMVEIAGEQVPVPAIRAEISKIAAMASAMVVSDLVSFRAAVDFASECARRAKLVDERFAKVDDKTKKAKKATDDARSEVLALIRELKAPFEKAQGIADQKAQAWKRIEDSRLALEAEVKRREAQVALDAEKKKQADALRDAGMDDLADKVATQALFAEVVVEKVEVPAGTTFRAHWKGVCTDFAALVAEVAVGRAPLDLLVLDQSAADGWARSTKGAAKIAGLEARDVGGASHS